MVCGDLKNDPPMPAGTCARSSGNQTQTINLIVVSSISLSANFEAQVIVLDHPNRIMAGYTPVLDCHTGMVTTKTSSYSIRRLLLTTLFVSFSFSPRCLPLQQA